MKLILVRHGQTHENVAGIIQGQSVGRLNMVGKEQAKKVGIRLKDEKIDVAYVSDLERACDTAKEILKWHPKTKVVYTKELRERHRGVWEGKLRKEILAQENEKGPYHLITPPGGESLEDAQKRIVLFYEKILKKHKRQTVLIVSHGGLLTPFYLYLFEKSFEEYKKYHPQNAAISIIEISEDRKHTVHLLNCVKHLE